MTRRTLVSGRTLVLLSLWSVAVVVPAGGVAAQLRPGDILYTEGGGLYRVTPDGAQSFFTGISGQGSSSVSDLVTGPGGAIYVSVNYSSPRPADLFRVDPVSGSLSLVTTIPRLGDSRGLAVEGAGTVLMAHNTDLLRIDPVTGGNTVVSSGGLLSASLRDVEVGPDGTVYVGRGDVEDVVRIDPVTGAQSRVVLGQVAGFGYFTVAPDGNLYYPRRVGTPGGVDPVRSQVVRHDLATGASMVIYDAPSTFEDFGFLIDLVIDPAGDILGTDQGQPIDRLSDGRIAKFDRETGERSSVYGPLPGIQNPQFIAIFVPEPGAAGVCVGAGGVLLMRRRRNRAIAMQ